MTTTVGVLVGLLCAVGALLVLASAVLMVRAPDAYVRISGLSPATSLGLPLIVLAGYLHKLTIVGFTWTGFVRLVLTVGALLVVSSVATNMLARAACLSGAPVSAATDPQDLAVEPADE